MRPDRLAVWGLIAIVIALLAVAFTQTGGPAAGRAEARDAARLSDLRDLRRFVVCVARTSGTHSLPGTLAPVDACPDITPREDRFTGTPYRYERLTDTTFRLCASFDVPERIPRAAAYSDALFDPETGCLTGAYLPPA